MSKKRTVAATSPAVRASERCSVLMSLGVIGDYWSLAVIRCAAFGLRRFGQFQEELDVATNVLTDRLNRLVEAEILSRVPYQERPLRNEYVLTEEGRELVPIILALKEWGDRYLQPLGPWTAFHHRGCASPVKFSLLCPDCGAAATKDVIDITLLRTA